MKTRFLKNPIRSFEQDGNGLKINLVHAWDVCHILAIVMLGVFMLSVFMLSVFMLSVFMLSVFMLSVFLPSVFMPSVFMLSVFMPIVFMPNVEASVFCILLSLLVLHLS